MHSGISMRLVIFHYHLLPGGVTGVIEESVKAVLPRIDFVDGVTLVCGNPENVDEVRNALSVLPQIDSVGFEIVPEIGYVSEGKNERGDLRERITRVLTTRFSGADTVWWVHNYHLGKNPYFTNALLDIAERDRAQRIVFHIHDFPECARYENLRFIRSVVDRPLYPQHDNVRYAVINARDERLLEQAGIAPGLVFLLQNPVTAGNRAGRPDGGPTDVADGKPPRAATDSSATRSISSQRRHEVRELLYESFRTEFPLYRPSQKMLLYPVRTIRRKNVLEAAFLTRLLSDEASLVVTLPGVSEQERKYSAMVEQAFHEGLVPGLWGIGRRLDELGIGFRELTDSTDVILSSSVQEGFGYQFISAVTWGHPLFARYLDVLGGVLPVFADFPHDFYQRVLVPLVSPSLSSMRAYLKMRYGERLSRIARFLSPEEAAVLESDIDAMLSEEVIDFSYLAPQMQYTLLRDLADSAYATEITSLNTGTIAAMRAVVLSHAQPQPERVDGIFGYDRFAETVRTILGSFDAPPPVRPAPATDVQSALVRSFATREYARLLYE